MIPNINIDRFTEVDDSLLIAEFSYMYEMNILTKGFYMTGERQNFPVHFVPSKTVRDSNGDVLRWDFVAADTPIKVVIYNM